MALLFLLSISLKVGSLLSLSLCACVCVSCIETTVLLLYWSWFFSIPQITSLHSTPLHSIPVHFIIIGTER